MDEEEWRFGNRLLAPKVILGHRDASYTRQFADINGVTIAEAMKSTVWIRISLRTLSAGWIDGASQAHTNRVRYDQKQIESALLQVLILM